MGARMGCWLDGYMDNRTDERVDGELNWQMAC